MKVTKLIEELCNHKPNALVGILIEDYHDEIYTNSIQGITYYPDLLIFNIFASSKCSKVITVKELIDSLGTNISSKAAVTVSGTIGPIEFENMSFDVIGYPDDTVVLYAKCETQKPFIQKHMERTTLFYEGYKV